MNRQRIYDAFQNRPLIQFYLIADVDGQTCHCGIGALLHGADVSDPTLWALQRELQDAGSEEVVDRILDEFADPLQTFYEFGRRSELVRALDLVFAAVDQDAVLDPDVLITRIPQEV